MFNFGSPDVEVVSRMIKKDYPIDINKTGSGAEISLKGLYCCYVSSGNHGTERQC